MSLPESHSTVVPHETLQLGQFIPLHYHHQMLNDSDRTGAFRQAILATVPEGGVALELGGGTGVQSFFAAQKARKVYCVERNPELVHAARALLRQNPGGNRVEVVNGDAFLYLPPEPVDVVICEMLHSALLREKQVAVIESFKQRYRARFGNVLPRFVPEATLLAAQPVYQDYVYHGYVAPVPVFDHPYSESPRTSPMADPHLYAMVDYAEPQSGDYAADVELTVAYSGVINALRFVTKSVLAIVGQEVVSDWHNQYLVMPLDNPLSVRAGDRVRMRFSYEAGAQLQDLSATMHLEHVLDVSGEGRKRA